MKVTEIIQQALSDGVTIAVDRTGILKLVGEEERVDRWLSTVRENKVAILAELVPACIPIVCRGCTRLEIVEIMEKPVAGCLYVAPGEYADGWKRLPTDLRKCLHEKE